jgi:D-hexose-6-phosphate mutarotase
LERLYAPIQGNARARKWEWADWGAGQGEVIGDFGIAFEMYMKKIPYKTLFKKTNQQKIRNERGYITAEPEKIQKIIRSYFKSLYSTKLENLDEMDNFLDRYHVPKLNQDQINDLNSPIFPK